MFYFYLDYTGQGYDFNTACPKILIKTLRQTLKIRICRVSRNTEFFVWPKYF